MTDQENQKAALALEFLKTFYLSDIGDDLKAKAKSILLNYFTHD